MKKKRTLLALFLAVLMLMGCLTACGASEAPAKAETSAQYNAEAETPAMEAVEAEEAVEELADFSTSSQTAGGAMEVEEVQTYAEKIIYSGRVYMETTEFDEALAALDKAVKEYGGFVQDSSVDGYARRYDDGTTAVTDRWAHYVVRIPAEKFDAFMALTDGIGNVTSSSRSAENVTSQYTDYEARLDSLTIQEERLLEMLEKATDLDSLITLEARLSEVRYEIESIERNLRNLDQRLAYSTVTLELQEVEVITKTATVQRTFGEKLGDAFADGWKNFSRGFQNFIISLARALPTLILLAVIAAVVLVVFFKIRKRKEQKAQTKEAPKDEK